MEIRPILSALTRNKTGAVLIALQIAFTLAVVLNAVFIVGKRVEKMNRPTGMDMENIVVAQNWIIAPDTDVEQMTRRDLAALRAIPGVINATASHQVPLSGGGWGDQIKTATGPDAPTVGTVRYPMDEGAVEALGLTISEGRGFRAEEINYREPNANPPVAGVLVTQALLDAAFDQGGGGVGSTLYDGLDRPFKVVGVIEQMHGAWINWDNLEHVLISPELPSGPLVRYMVRAEPGMVQSLLPQVEETLIGIDRNRVIRRVRTMAELAGNSYTGDRTMAVVLACVVMLLIVITSLGIVGLASFSVRQRTKQIGTRRAIGARRFDIVRYFLLENWLTTTFGVALGVVLTLGFNYWLVTEYSLERLHPVYLPVGIMGLWLLGLGSVLGPARRAAAIAPAVATRTV